MSSGMNDVCAAALLADSGAATPSMAPLPNFSGFLEIRFSREYDVKLASTWPPPGSTPSSEPIVVPRRTGIRMRRKSSLVSHRPWTFLVTRLGLIRCSRLRMISARPKRPTARDTKSSPPYSSRTPNVKRGTPVNPSCPMVPSSSPSTIIASALIADPLARAIEASRPRTTMEK